MVRQLVEIEPCDHGWRVRAPGREFECPTKFHAIEEAHAWAARHYVETGQPTAVRVQVAGGGSVVVGSCG